MNFIQILARILITRSYRNVFSKDNAPIINVLLMLSDLSVVIINNYYSVMIFCSKFSLHFILFWGAHNVKKSFSYCGLPIHLHFLFYSYLIHVEQ